MSRVACMLAATAALAACPRPPKPPHPDPGIGSPDLRIRVAQAEARRGGGLSELIEIATHGATPEERALALRGLGRIGGPQALAALRAALVDPDHLVVLGAAAAIGVSLSLDEPAADEPSDIGHELEAALAALPEPFKPVVIEAIGRAADQRSEPALVAGLSGPPRIAEASALALGRFGRRKIAWSPLARETLAAVSGNPREPGVRHAAVYALSREMLPIAAPANAIAPTGGAPVAGTPTAATPAASYAQLTQPLVNRLADDDPETRALAIAAFDKHDLVGAAHAQIEHALLDRDWRVAVAAINALAGKHGDDAGRDAVAAALARRATELERGTATEAHVVLLGLELLADVGNRPLVLASAGAIGTRIGANPSVPALTRGWIECRAEVVVQHGSAAPDLAAVQACGHGGLPDHLRLPLVAALVKDKVGKLEQRRAALGALLIHKDPRVRAAALGALSALWAEGDQADHRAAIATLVSAIASADPIIAGSAVDAATELYDAIGGPDSALDAAVIARAARTSEPELAAALLELIGKRKLAGGAEVCRAGLAAAPVRAKAARTCLGALGEAVPAPPVGPATPPPVNVADVVMKRVHWHLVTTRGEIVIALRPDVAPWAVATIASLTAKGFYDGLEVHRVVPGFVVQGGDPTQSGWGGPDFTLPAEPGSLADGAGYVAGGVGLADAGRDSAGSQWFVMHGGAPHLDGRYTWIGAVESGQKSADALLIGDKVVRATISVELP